MATERADEDVLTVVGDGVDINREADSRARGEDALGLRADAGVWDAPHAAQAKSTYTSAEAHSMRLEIRGRTPTLQSLADDPAGACPMASCQSMPCGVLRFRICVASTRCRRATLMSMISVDPHRVLLWPVLVGLS